MAGAKLRGTASSSLTSVQKQFNTDDYEELSIIEITDSTAKIFQQYEEIKDLINAENIDGDPDKFAKKVRDSYFSSLILSPQLFFLKKVRKKSSGEEFYLSYAFGSKVAAPIPEIHDNEFIPVSKLRGKIGKFQPTAIRNTASSVKGQSKSGDEANTLVSKTTIPKKTINQIENNLDKVVEELSRKYYNSRTKEFNVKFFYLGDLIDVAVESLYEHGGASKDMKVIAKQDQD